MHPQTLPFSQSPSTPPSFWAERALFGRISPNWFFSSLFLSDFPQHFTFKCEPAYLLLVNPVPIFLLLFPLLFFPLYSSFQRSKPPEWEGAKPFINLHTHTNSLFPTYTKNSLKKHISQFSFQSFAHYTLVTTRKKHTADTKDFFPARKQRVAAKTRVVFVARIDKCWKLLLLLCNRVYAKKESNGLGEGINIRENDGKKPKEELQSIDTQTPIIDYERRKKKKLWYRRGPHPTPPKKKYYYFVYSVYPLLLLPLSTYVPVLYSYRATL